jgi:acylpyruvate hydrolase
MSSFLDAGDDAMSLAREVLAERTQRAAVPETDDPHHFAPLIDRPGKIICIGRNYREHAHEMGQPVPDWPEIFLRQPETLIGPYDDIERPSLSSRVDYEGELCVIVGREGRHIPAAEAFNVIAGYCVANDFTMRDWQHRGQQWTPGKNFDRTLPIGPALVTQDEVGIPDLDLETRVNGEVVQVARTSAMIFDIPTQIEFVSSWTTLRPGDVILTGTPGGVGVSREPPLLLEEGDIVEVTVERIGSIRNRIVGDPSNPATDRWKAIAAQGKSPSAKARAVA